MTTGPLPMTSTQLRRLGADGEPGARRRRRLSSTPSAAPSPVAVLVGTPARHMRRNSSNTSARSWGPGAPSGWYCTLNAGSSRWRSPSTLWSLRLRSLTYQPLSAGMLSASTWNSWLCEVTRTVPRSSSPTGWLPPWWPNGRREVVAPMARPSTWWPRQMPSSGMRRSSSARVSATGAVEPHRVAGAVGEEHAVGSQREDVVDGRVVAHHDDLGAAAAQGAQLVVLHPHVDHHDAHAR